jgi:phenylacetate-CoA ligase
MPLTVVGTELTKFFEHVFTLRDQLWHRFDFTNTMAVIRLSSHGAGKYPDGLSAANWGPWTGAIFESGPSYLLNTQATVDQQAEWLSRRDPHYLMTYPSNLMALITLCRERDISFANLQAVVTIAEALHPEVRQACREVWGVPLFDIYSAAEAGYIALQCPDHEHYHVQSENVFVEVLDEEGRRCRPGETGRVVVTPLHNFAMPLIRYDIGDYAVVGEPCPCGRGLPVLQRILGRTRNMLTLPSGEKRWPSFTAEVILAVAPIRQIQLIQHSLVEIEVKLAVNDPLTPGQERRLREVLSEHLGHGFTLGFTYVDEISRSAGGKYEDFRSEIGFLGR